MVLRPYSRNDCSLLLPPSHLKHLLLLPRVTLGPHEVTCLFQRPISDLSGLKLTGHCSQTAPSLKVDSHQLTCGTHPTPGSQVAKPGAVVAGPWGLRTLSWVHSGAGCLGVRPRLPSCFPELLLREGHPLLEGTGLCHRDSGACRVKASWTRYLPVRPRAPQGPGS